MVDLYRENKQDLERKTLEKSPYSKKLKKQFFDERMDRVKEYSKNANDQHSRERAIRLRRQTLEKYNKYNNSNFNY